MEYSLQVEKTKSDLRSLVMHVSRKSKVKQVYLLRNFTDFLTWYTYCKREMWCSSPSDIISQRILFKTLLPRIRMFWNTICEMLNYISFLYHFSTCFKVRPFLKHKSESSRKKIFIFLVFVMLQFYQHYFFEINWRIYLEKRSSITKQNMITTNLAKCLIFVS